eukprot:3007747-Pyramimonas_sp.AAC.1
MAAVREHLTPLTEAIVDNKSLGKNAREAAFGEARAKAGEAVRAAGESQWRQRIGNMPGAGTNRCGCVTRFLLA